MSPGVYQRCRDRTETHVLAPCAAAICRRPTYQGARQDQGAKLERPTGRMSLAPWSWCARLCLGRRRAGWQPNHPSTRTTGTSFPILEPEFPAGGICNRSHHGAAGRVRPMPAGARQQAATPAGAVRRASGALMAHSRLNAAVHALQNRFRRGTISPASPRR